MIQYNTHEALQELIIYLLSPTNGKPRIIDIAVCLVHAVITGCHSHLSETVQINFLLQGKTKLSQSSLNSKIIWYENDNQHTMK